MTLDERTESLAKAIFATLQTSPDANQTKEARDVIEKAIIEVVLEERQRCAGVAVAQGTPDADRASKIADEIRRAEGAEIAGQAARQW
jgi:hypothetical protein